MDPNATTTTQQAPQNGAALAPAETKAPLAAPANTELFAGAEDWSTAQRIATALAKSTLVPKEYQNNVPNVLIAMEIAGRVKASVFSVMQSLDVIHGRPGWRSQFLIATVNQCGRFTPLRFHFSGTKGKDDYGCCCIASDIKTGEILEGETITMTMAREEGWATRNGSKYRTMPGQMLRYRAAAFWTRVYAPELSLGMQTSDELHDTLGGADWRGGQDMPQGLTAGTPQSLEAAIGLSPRATAIETQGEDVPADDDGDASSSDRTESQSQPAQPAQQSLVPDGPATTKRPR